MTTCENFKHGVAIHCKAGLGRTGSLIALYAIKHYNFPADAFIGYIRVARPGSVLGPQQQFLCEMQEIMFKKGIEYRKLNGLPEDLILKMESMKISSEKLKQSEQDKKIAEFGDKGQGKYLTDKQKDRK